MKNEMDTWREESQRYLETRMRETWREEECDGYLERRMPKILGEKNVGDLERRKMSF